MNTNLKFESIVNKMLFEGHPGPHIIDDPNIPIKTIIARIGSKRLKYAISEFMKGVPVEIIKDSAPESGLYFISTGNLERALRYRLGNKVFEDQLKKMEDPEYIQQQNQLRLQELEQKDQEAQLRRKEAPYKGQITKKESGPRELTDRERRLRQVHYQQLKRLGIEGAPKHQVTFTQKVMNLKDQGYDAETIAKMINRQAAYTSSFERITPEKIQQIINDQA